MENSKKYPYKCEATGAWIYNAVPEGLRKAAEADIRIGVIVLYRNRLKAHEEYMSHPVRENNIFALLSHAHAGDVWVKDALLK